MISLNQILLLEQKVESAVEKIQRLQAENDALRKSCAELTNALSVKSEQLSQFEQEQDKIESGIKNALEKLTAIENSVVESASQRPQSIQNTETPPAQNNIVPHAPQNETSSNVSVSSPVNTQETISQPENNSTPQQETVIQPAASYDEGTTNQENTISPQQSPFTQTVHSYNDESPAQENNTYPQTEENSFDGELLFSTAPETNEVDDTEIDSFYEEQESFEDDTSNNGQDNSQIDIY